MDKEYRDLITKKQQLPAALDPNYTTKHHQLAILAEQLLQKVENEGLFSRNEEADDLATSSLKYLDLWFIYGEILDIAKVDTEKDRIIGRMLILQSAVRAYLNYLGLLQDYHLLVKPLEDLYHKVSGSSQFDLTKAPLSSRETKIQMYSLSKGASEVWQEQRTKLKADKDEEQQREAYFSKLNYEATEAWKNIANNAQELMMLASMAQVKPEDALREGHLEMKETTFNDARKQDNSTKVEIEPGMASRGGPIMGQKGRVLRPFTLTRDQVQNTVMGTGQVLPSMTVEEFVDMELKNGGMLKPEEAKEEDDEDDMEFQDRETERLRRWDDFTDANPKGSGNTMNLG